MKGCYIPMENLTLILQKGLPSQKTFIKVDVWTCHHRFRLNVKTMQLRPKRFHLAQNEVDFGAKTGGVDWLASISASKGSNA